ncbi:MAG TPA: type II secretion system protein GspM [Rubrivivax sp.]|nr:type II secretion system protein GspM [Rubrivivax sp.]
MSTRARALAWASAFWLLVLGTLLVLAGQWVWHRQQAWAQLLETIEPRIARLEGLAGSSQQLQQAVQQTERDVLRHAYAAARDASQAGNDAQQRVRELFSRSGLEVLSLQVLPARAVPRFDRIPIAVRVEGELSVLQATLAALSTLSPSVFVEGFVLQGASANEAAPPRVVAELQLFVLRAQA